jgi:tetratricopeptide (TPR) repeat protein
MYLKSIKLIITALVLMLVTSCKKNLDLTNPYALSLNPNTAYTNLDDLSGLLNGVYGAFQSATYYNGFYGCTLDVLTDNAYETNASLANYQLIANWDYFGIENAFRAAFVTPYNVIYQSNYILENSVKLKGEAEERKFNRIAGQAMAARAIAHFDLLRGFSDNLDRNSLGLGIPIKKDVQIGSPARASVKQVYDFLYEELDSAITLLQQTDLTINLTLRSAIDEQVAHAAYARIAYYAKDYEKAITHATEVIDIIPLATIVEYPLVWSDGISSSEIIWAIQNNIRQGDASTSITPSSDLVNFGIRNASFSPHPSLLNVFDKTNDVRYASFFQTWSQLYPINSFPLNFPFPLNTPVFTKFAGKKPSPIGLSNFTVFRAAEMYLILAESYAMTDKIAEANQYLNELRQNRINNYADQTYAKDELISQIQLERRKELMLEGHRWFDLKRTTREVNRTLDGTINPNLNVRTNLPNNSHKWVWPIPDVELRINPNMVPNPGY